MEIRKTTVEKVMRVWAKLCSLGVVFLIFYLIHLAFSFVELYNESQQLLNPTVSLNQLIFYLGVIVLSIAGSLLTYSPYFYYGWFDRPHDKYMRIYTKILAIFLSVVILFGFLVDPYKNPNAKDILFVILIVLALLAPLYYYGWKAEKRKIVVY